MSKKRLIQLITIGKMSLYVLLSITLRGQTQQTDFSKGYIPLRSSGTLPDVFLRSAKEQSQEELSKLKNDEEKKLKTQFILSNNHFIHDFLLSGQVLVNDPLTIYVNKVAAEVVEQNPSIGSQPVQLFVTKSPEVNAYAFDKGVIFVNIGLLAQLENEAQLAYILAHELVHIKKKHSVTEYLENKHNEAMTSNHGEDEDKSLAMYRFSKDQETEADINGLDLIKNTNYSVKAVTGAFDVMQYSYLPFELPEFKKSFLEDQYLKIPDTLNLKKVSVIKSNDDYDDSKSTHPNIRKRRMSIEDDIRKISETGRKKYIVSEEQFKNIREQARFELCRTYLLKRDYVNAVYAAYILLQKYPDNCYLKKIVAKGLYNITVSKSGKSTEGVIKIGAAGSFGIADYGEVEGASQRLYYLLDKLSAKELNVIALSYAYKASKQYPADKILSTITDSLFSCLANNNKIYLSDFSNKTLEELKDTTKTVTATVQEEPVEESKYATIKRLQKDEELDPDLSFIKYAFVGLLQDADFVKRYKDISKVHDSNTTEEYVTSSKQKKGKKGADFLGIDKVIFVDPYYRRVKRDRNEVTEKFEESSVQQEKLIKIQETCAEKLKLDYTWISTLHLTKDNIEQFNDVAIINEWIAERFRHGDDDEFMESSEAMKELITRKGTKYIVLTGVYNSNKKNSSYLFMILDLETGKVMRSELKSNRERDSNDMLHTYVYNSLMFVKKKQK